MNTDKKIFVIDYVLINDRDQIKSHYTYAQSRKSAEYNTRNMEYPDKINVIKIFPISFEDSAVTEMLDELFINYKTIVNANFKYDESEELTYV